MIDKISKIETGYAAIVNLLTWIVTYTVCHISDNMLGTLGKVVAILAPLPNAINVFYIVRHTLDYHIVAALAVAIVLEAVLFVTFETMLRQYEMYLEDKVTYKVTLSTSVISSVVILGLVMLLIAMLEGMGVPLIFPLINAVVYISIAINRWTDRIGDNKVADELEELQTKLQTTIDDLQMKNTKLSTTNEMLQTKSKELQMTLDNIADGSSITNAELQTTEHKLQTIKHMLPTTYHSVVDDLLQRVSNNEVKSKNSFATIKELPTEKAKVVFDIAEELEVIYKNGDGNYHINN